ncbi:hypothetical protein BC833DRAFT_562293 [Globomyces pollinis-pini]|nr:hypothetical protein BC833DRAFT_562293 [Globomyces pollinis-pini]
MNLIQLILLFFAFLIHAKNTLNDDDKNDFIPTNEFKPVLPGQKIPKGLHVRMNFETGVIEAKILDSNTDQSNDLAIKIDDSNTQTVTHDNIMKSDGNIKNTEVKEKDLSNEFNPKELVDSIESDSNNQKESSNEPIKIHKPESSKLQGLTIVEKDSLKSLLEQINSKEEMKAIDILQNLQDAAYQVDVGIGMAQELEDMKFLVQLLKTSSLNIKASIASLFGTIVSNNPDAAENIYQIPGFVNDIWREFLSLQDIRFSGANAESLDRTRSKLFFAIASLTRSHTDSRSKFLTPDILIELRNIFNMEQNSKIKKQMMNYLIDVKESIPTDFILPFDEPDSLNSRDSLPLDDLSGLLEDLIDYHDMCSNCNDKEL